MKQLLLTLALLNTALFGFAQDAEYAEIQFMPYIYTKGMVGNIIESQMKNSTFKLYINDKLVTTLRVDEILNYKLYSKGRLVFSLVDQSGQVSGTMDISENKTYYIIVGHEYKVSKSASFRNQEISKEVADALKISYEIGYKNTINLAEDIKNPVGELPKGIAAGSAGQGSGFLLNDKGYVLTNYHVVDGAKKITIKGINGDYNTGFDAGVISADEVNDLALLKINSTLITFPNPPYSIASSKEVKQGEKVFALGYPIKDIMGSEIKVTDGIINSKSGYKGSISQFQFSAAVQPGNSGGPLMNMNGEVIGIVTAKLNPELVESAGYAIKSDYVLFFISQAGNFEYQPPASSLIGKELSELVGAVSKYVYIIETE